MSEQPQNKVDLRITPEFAAQAGKGRPKGVPNKATKALRDMILEALDRKGGVDYLAKQADENPTAFLTLVGKVMPTQLVGDAANPIALVDLTEDRDHVLSVMADLVRRSSQSATLQ